MLSVLAICTNTIKFQQMTLDLEAEAVAEIAHHVAGHALVEVDDDAARGADEMVMPPFRANIGRAMFAHIDGTYNVQLGEQFERAIDRGATNGRVDTLGAPQNLRWIEMFAFLLDHLQHGQAWGRNLVTGVTQSPNKRSFFAHALSLHQLRQFYKQNYMLSL